MSKTLKNIFQWIILIIFGLVVGWSIVYLFKSKTPSQYTEVTEDFVFKIRPKFTDYYLAVTDLTSAKFRLHKKDLTDQQRDAIKSGLPKIKMRIENTSAELDIILNEAIQHYGDGVKPSIEEFTAWKNSINVNKLSTNDDEYIWERQFRNMKYKIYNQLRKVSGYYNIENVRHALVMHLLPGAKETLRNNPNDPKLCTVMKKFEKTKEPQSIAQQIAFIDIGETYCDQYYHQRSAWGITQIDSKKVKSSENKYENLSYTVYYEQYVLPLVPKATKELKNKEENSYICREEGIWSGERNPKQDALRVAYRNEGHNHCPTLTPLEQKNYMDTSYVCIVVNEFFCDGANRCDVFERCKPTNGVLFKEE